MSVFLLSEISLADDGRKHKKAIYIYINLTKIISINLLTAHQIKNESFTYVTIAAGQISLWTKQYVEAHRI